MKNGFVIFLAVFAVLLASWSAFVLGPQLQLGREKQVPFVFSRIHKNLHVIQTDKNSSISDDPSVVNFGQLMTP